VSGNICFRFCVNLNFKQYSEDEFGTIMYYSAFVKITDKEKIEKLKRTKNFLSGKNEDFFMLFHI
jgi:hypothetical protein